MFIRVGYEITIDCADATVLVLALMPHSDVPGRIVGSAEVRTMPGCDTETFLDPFGNRLTRLRAPRGSITLWSDCMVEVDGLPDPVNWGAVQHQIDDLPPEVLPYLSASRFCESDLLSGEALRLFGGYAPGWARVQAITTFVHRHIKFGYGFGRPTRTAFETYNDGMGVCRDFAHLAITLCRAMTIPARYASGYLGDVGIPYSGPGDFCAWFEVYLGGRWHVFDARYDTPRIGRVKMVNGRDAVDGAMITSFGSHQLRAFRVWTDEVPGSPDDAEMLRQLDTRPSLSAVPLPLVRQFPT